MSKTSERKEKMFVEAGHQFYNSEESISFAVSRLNNEKAPAAELICSLRPAMNSTIRRHGFLSSVEK